MCLCVGFTWTISFSAEYAALYANVQSTFAGQRYGGDARHGHIAERRLLSGAIPPPRFRITLIHAFAFAGFRVARPRELHDDISLHARQSKGFAVGDAQTGTTVRRGQLESGRE
jgi:hypothetical protein